jgi:ribonuclease HI
MDFHIVSCDGSCTGNGTKHAKAAYAYAFIYGSLKGNYEAKLLKHKEKNSNNRAELWAVLKALKFIKKNK